MKTAADPVEAPVVLAPTDARTSTGRPENSVASILLMVLLAASALYAADWIVREDETVVQHWDFSTERPDSNAWTFPVEGWTRSTEGVSYEISASTIGPKLTWSFPAAEVSRIRAKVAVTDAATGKPAPFALGWYWARSADLAATPEEPFNSARGMQFIPIARHWPHELRVYVGNHPDWNGTIEMATLSIKLPAGAAGPFRVTLSRVDLVE